MITGIEMHEHVGRDTPSGRSAGGGRLALGLLAAVAVLALAAGCTTEDSTAAEAAGSAPAPATKSSAAPAPSKSSAAKKSVKDDVVLDSCGPSGNEFLPYVQVKGTATNSSSKVSNYLITVEVVDKTGKRLDEASAFANMVAPGQAVAFDGIATDAKDLAEGSYDCKVLDVSRFAA